MSNVVVVGGGPLECWHAAMAAAGKDTASCSWKE